MEQLARTDRLIDAVVYRLYGLTEEEIRVGAGDEWKRGGDLYGRPVPPEIAQQAQ